MTRRNTNTITAPTPAKRPRRLADHEMGIMQKVCQLLATLPPGARVRVLGYVCARAESLPVIAAVGGGTDDAPAPMLPFHRTEQDVTAQN